MSKIQFNKDFYIYSSHKTATQSLCSMFNTRHIHSISNINYTKEAFIKDVKEYHNKNKKKIKIIY